ncbi:MAG TPA: ELM1/GtrOC1 family putative glycosyltransferase, partial [Candidatus Omnitrophota bacterium]|nr:ELM1/GtrOC1 family putative glycosyltransferase [Candidatus Omnitrophota bacterium]
DIVISCGSSLSAANQVLSFENNAKSFVIMKPAHFPASRFDLVISHRHDRLRERDNVVSITGSLNTVNELSTEMDFKELAKVRRGLSEIPDMKVPKIGVLLGGDSKHFEFTACIAESICQQLREFLKKNRAVILLTTSRRTPKAVTDIFKEYFSKDSACRLFVVAEEDNPKGTIGGIFYLSDILLVSGESISMVSEAAASGKQTVVFAIKSKGKGNKIERFLKDMTARNFIKFVSHEEISRIFEKIISGEEKTAKLTVEEYVSRKIKGLLKG